MAKRWNSAEPLTAMLVQPLAWASAIISLTARVVGLFAEIRSPWSVTAEPSVRRTVRLFRSTHRKAISSSSGRVPPKISIHSRT